MKPTLATTLSQERGTLTARATLEEPDVRLESTPGTAPMLTIEEAGVRLDLAFPDTDCIRRFQGRVSRVHVRPANDER